MKLLVLGMLLALVSATGAEAAPVKVRLRAQLPLVAYVQNGVSQTPGANVATLWPVDFTIADNGRSITAYNNLRPKLTRLSRSGKSYRGIVSQSPFQVNGVSCLERITLIYSKTTRLHNLGYLIQFACQSGETLESLYASQFRR